MEDSPLTNNSQFSIIHSQLSVVYVMIVPLLVV